MIEDVLQSASANALDYSIELALAEMLSGIVTMPGDLRAEMLGKVHGKIGTPAFIDLFAQFIGLANSALHNSGEMIDIIMLCEGIRHPDRNSDRANLPTLFGALRGIIMAEGIDETKTCEGCAFRVATPANQSPITTTEAHDCVQDGSRFLCHEELDDSLRPYKACAGYAQSRKQAAAIEAAGGIG